MGFMKEGGGYRIFDPPCNYTTKHRKTMSPREAACIRLQLEWDWACKTRSFWNCSK